QRQGDAIAVLVRNRFGEQIDRGATERDQLGVCENGLPDVQLTAPSEESREHAVVTRIHVLLDENGGRELQRQRRDGWVERGASAGGGAKCHAIELRSVGLGPRASLVFHETVLRSVCRG